MKPVLFTLLSIFVLIIACDIYPQDEYEEFYVVESYLIAQDSLPPLYLSRTAPVSALYLFEDFAVAGANVRIHLLSGGQGSSIEQTFTYQMVDNGVYNSSITHEVMPARTYQLEIDIPSDPSALITAYTAVPDTFSSQSTVPDSIVYQSENQLELDISPSRNTERQTYFIFTTIAQNPSLENFTPLYADLYDPETDRFSDFVKISSGIVNEANFETKPDGTVTLKYPWLAVAFYENNTIVTNVLDDNVYDFVRSQAVQLGGSTLSPGEIPNLVYRMEGGIGVFGSLAADTIQTYVKRPE